MLEKLLLLSQGCLEETIGEIIQINNSNEIEPVSEETAIVELTEGLLMDARSSINAQKAISFPRLTLYEAYAGTGNEKGELSSSPQKIDDL